MNSKPIKILFLLLLISFFAFLLWVLFLANTGADSIWFDFVRSFPYGDKVGHIGLFGVLTMLSIVGTGFYSILMGRYHLYIGALFVIIFVVIEELSQLFIALRAFDVFDLTADFVGISLASLMAKHLSKRRFSQQRQL